MASGFLVSIIIWYIPGLQPGYIYIPNIWSLATQDGGEDLAIQPLTEPQEAGLKALVFDDLVVLQIVFWRWVWVPKDPGFKFFGRTLLRVFLVGMIPVCFSKMEDLRPFCGHHDTGKSCFLSQTKNIFVFSQPSLVLFGQKLIAFPFPGALPPQRHPLVPGVPGGPGWWRGLGAALGAGAAAGAAPAAQRGVGQSGRGAAGGRPSNAFGEPRVFSVDLWGPWGLGGQGWPTRHTTLCTPH